MQFIVCDDFVEPAVADEFERLMLSNQFPWFFYANVNYSVPPPEGRQSPTLLHDATRFRDSIVTVTFQPLSSSSTVVEIHQVGLPDEEARASHHAGWSDALRELDRTPNNRRAES